MSNDFERQLRERFAEHAASAPEPADLVDRILGDTTRAPDERPVRGWTSARWWAPAAAAAAVVAIASGVYAASQQRHPGADHPAVLSTPRAPNSATAGAATPTTPPPGPPQRRTSGSAPTSHSSIGVATQTPGGPPPSATGHPPTTSASPSATSCRTSALKLIPGLNQGFAGGQGQTFYLQNTGDTACTMYGYPGVAMLDSAGRVIQRPAARSDGQPRPSLVSLKPGQRAQFVLMTVDGGIPGSGCTSSWITARTIQVYPPNETTPIRMPSRFGACNLQVRAVSAAQ